MKVVALVSGGKDSVFSIFHCIANGHDVVALANLHPHCGEPDELDSYMFQTVGHDAIPYLASCIANPAHENQDSAPDIPLFRRPTKGKAISSELRYTGGPNTQDEVEDLFLLLQDVKSNVPDVQAVCSGAILSTYQRLRVENVCQRLGLQSLAYLWNADQSLLLDSIIKSNLDCVLIKVATIGLKETHLGKSLKDMQPHLEAMAKKFGINVCGEGGEYETLTLDAPFFRRRLFLQATRQVIVHADADAPTAHLAIEKISCENKSPCGMLYSKIKADIASMKAYPALSVDKRITLINHTPKISGAPTLLKINFGSTEMPAVVPKLLVNGNIIYATDVCSKDGSNTDISKLAEDVLSDLRDLLAQKNFSFENLVFVHVYVKNMENFVALNAVYGRFFGFGPASRACVEASINSAIQIDAIGVTDTSVRRALHVPSISYWAPANIGPYSQCCTVTDGLSFIAGQIGFIPEIMTLPSDLLTQAILALRHAKFVAQAQQACRANISAEEKFISCVCYVTELSAENEAIVKTLYQRPILIVQVPKLPRNALIEWMIVSSDDASSEKTEYSNIKFSNDAAKHRAAGTLQKCANVAAAIAYITVHECKSAEEAKSLLCDVAIQMAASVRLGKASTRIFYHHALGAGFRKLAQDSVANCAIVPCEAINGDSHVAIVMHFSGAVN